MRSLKFIFGSIGFLIVCAIGTAQAQTFSIKPRGTVFICEGDSVTVKAASGFTNYYWSTSQKGQSITIYKPGRYVGYGFIGRTQFSDTVELKFYSKKTLTLSSVPKTKEICLGDSVIIEASKGFKSYSWTDKKTGPRVVYKLKASTSIVCEAVDSNGCNYKEDIRITVKKCSGCPKVLSGSPHLCTEKDSVTLEAKSGYKNYKWIGGPSGRLYTVKKAGWYYVEFSDGTTSCKDSIYVSKGKLKFSITSKPSPPVICKGDSIKLSVPYKGFKSIWWSTGSKDNDFWFKPTSSKKVVVEATDENGCDYRETIEITVKDTCKDDCDVLEAWPDALICGDKDSVILEAKFGYKKYLWNDKGDGRVRTVKKEGWYWVEVISQAGDTCRDSVYVRKAKAKELKLSSSPNPAVICPGDKVVLEASSGFKSYAWNTGHKNTNRVVLENILRTKGVVVEAVDSNGCPARAVLYITVKDTCKKDCDVLEAWPKKVLCGDKDSVILEAKFGYKKYLWNDKGDGRLRTVKKEGWYWVQVISQAGDTCTDSMYIDKVQPKELKLFTNPNPPKVCKGKKLVIEASGGFKSYYWSNRETGDRVVLYPTESGKIVLEAVDSNGCVARKVLEYKVDTCTNGINEFGKVAIELYPNPGSGIVTLELSSYEPGTAYIYDAAGRLVYVQVLKANKTYMDLAHLKPGSYTVRYWNSKSISHKQLLINKD